MYASAADAVVMLHVLYVGYVVLGQAVIVAAGAFRAEWGRNPWFRWSHLLMIAIVVVEEGLGWTCPLTTWERDLRELAGQVVSDQTFMDRLGQYLLFSKTDLYGWTPQTIAAVNVAFGVVVFQGFVMYPPRLFRLSRPLPVSEPAAVLV